ncbi:MAG TPA: cupin domain-containing protein [Burkholderiaceae bacterium]|nr:cupin domain-containing protein [Burkholderiaceae bacterium]
MSDQAVAQKGQPSWVRPEGASFADWMETRIARFETRSYDWDALKFQAEVDPRYRRAQMRYVGTGATGVSTDANTVPSENFTFSTMVVPGRGVAPMHIHHDVEEVFFVIRGKMKLILEKDGERYETILNERDLVSVPPGVYRGEENLTDEDALMLVILGAKKPQIPNYPPEHPLSKVKR